ncbi:hypothetical protein KJY73_20745 [Bowmanella sp. Y26]|uniref:hypothetical protein n=1 Tax=Bowmanella yangjiangensis TaxID=2811230 RepID=UPI001BDBF922|nr:hypothetical protein [Bowmanella yangjiangensis]MBT1066015.1 hypothetical protein [Bowmanella yangjiangensis]
MQNKDNLQHASLHDENVREIHSERRKKEHQETMACFVIQGSDPIGRKINNIFSKADEYVIYEVENCQLHESIKVYIEHVDEAEDALIIRYNDIKPDFDEFISVLCKYSLDDSYKKRASTAITLALDGKSEEAKKIFTRLKQDAENEYTEKVKGRLSYQTGAIALCALISLISIPTYLFRNSDFVATNPVLFEILVLIALSSMGGVLSVSLNVKSLTIDRGLSLKTYFFLGSERILISLIGGVLTYILIKSNLAFGVLYNEGSNFFAVLAIGFLAGFSETLVPNTLRNIEREKSS